MYCLIESSNSYDIGGWDITHIGFIENVAFLNISWREDTRKYW